MQRHIGDRAGRVILPAIDGSIFDTDTLKGSRYMLSLFRFASCPFCNLRVHKLVNRFDELGEGFTIVAVFDSPLDNLKRFANGHHAPFPIVADEEGAVHAAYGTTHSVVGMFKGMFLRAPTLMKAMFKGYLPTRIKGSMTQMPADFLIDEHGVIQTAYYGADEGDHLSFEDVKTFSVSGMPPSPGGPEA